MSGEAVEVEAVASPRPGVVEQRIRHLDSNRRSPAVFYHWTEALDQAGQLAVAAVAAAAADKTPATQVAPAVTALLERISGVRP